jgi:nucleobase:cation symporter-1, NCS1 family
MTCTAPVASLEALPSSITIVETPANSVATDRAGQVEQHGIDFIPAAERHGRARELFAVWAMSNVTYLYIVLGGTMILLGLNVWQAMAVVVAGNLFWALVGLLAVSGPSSGTPSGVVARSMFGVRGNRVNVAIVGWVIAVSYEAINLIVGSLAGFAFIEQIGLKASIPVKLAIVVATAVVTLAISVYGHATIVKVSNWFAIGLVACCAVLAFYVIRVADVHYVPASAPHGTALWAAAFVGLTIIASGPLSWGSGADYARYLPETTSAKATAGWTALGGFAPAVLLGALGVLAGTAVDMTDPQTSLQAILPGWFYPLFLLAIVVGSITNNVLTAYSSGLSLQAVGVKASRAFTVFFDGVVGVSLALYALFISNFMETVNSILELSVSLLGPSLAIYGADIILRRNRYDGRSLHDETPSSPFWYRNGINWFGVIGQVVGTSLALLCVNTTMFVGPLANALGGADLSCLVGPVMGAGVYAALTLNARRQRSHSVATARLETAPVAIASYGTLVAVD